MMSEKVREFVIAAHRDLDPVKAIYAEHPEIIDEAVEWRPNQTETALQAAAHTGQREIAEFLLANGATPNMVAYAMLGDEEGFTAMLADDSDNIHEIGAHNFSLMFHAGLGGNLAIIERIYQDVDDINLDSVLLSTVMGGHVDATKWAIDKGASFDGTDFRGRTALQMAVEMENDDLITLLQGAIGKENLSACENCGTVGYSYLAEIDGNMMGAHTKIFKCKKCGHQLETVIVE